MQTWEKKHKNSKSVWKSTLKKMGSSKKELQDKFKPIIHTGKIKSSKWVCELKPYRKVKANNF